MGRRTVAGDDNQGIRLTGIDALRGLAALSVCLAHVTFAHEVYVSENSMLRGLARFGPLGVQVFFVISGFVIPYSLSVAGYRLADAPRFLLRRVLRIDPPYLVAAVLAVLLGYLSSITPGYRGSPFAVDWVAMAMHVGYLNGLLGRPWAIPVFWTLAIEFQYYIFVSLVFPLLAHRRRWIAWSFVMLFAAGGLVVESQDILFHHGSLFAMGFLAWRFVARRDAIWEWVVLSICCMCLTAVSLRAVEAFAAAMAIPAILFWRVRARPLLALGAISYSLYLTHPLVGSRIISLLDRAGVHGALSELGVACGIVGSLAFAWMFWRVVESPAHQFARRIRLRHQKVGEA